ncbi:MAG: alpha-L-fucosidase, partial [Clostridiales bacterium]|nr:alpha-L-fucosidase [Clostridiales bacterium]
VGGLAKACRSKGMRFGVYYSSLLDWTFTDKPVPTVTELFLGNNNTWGYM